MFFNSADKFASNFLYAVVLTILDIPFKYILERLIPNMTLHKDNANTYRYMYNSRGIQMVSTKLCINMFMDYSVLVK